MVLAGVAVAILAFGGWRAYERREAEARWYEDWLKQPYAKNCRFDSEFELKAGETRKVEIRSEAPQWVGWVTKKNEVITNNSHAVVFGRRADTPFHNAAKGLSLFMEPSEGVITAYFRNESGIDTRLMVWTATEKEPPGFAGERLKEEEDLYGARR